MENTLLSSPVGDESGEGSVDIRAAIQNYKAALDVVEKQGLHSDKSEVLALLIARDELENLFANKLAPDSATFTNMFDFDQQVTDLDHRLQRLGETVAGTISLDKWKQRLERDDEYRWWWQFEKPRQVDRWDRVDWLWDALTLGTVMAPDQDAVWA